MTPKNTPIFFIYLLLMSVWGAVVRLNNIALFATAMIHATHGSSATWKRCDTSVISKGNEIRDVWHRQVRGHSLRLLEPFIGVVGFDYVITFKFQHFS